MIRQAFREESKSLTRKVQIHRYRKRRYMWRAKSRACSSFSLTWRGLFTNNSVWQAKESIPHTTVNFCGDCFKMCQDFSPNFGDKTTFCCITTTHHLTLPFHQGIFYQNRMTVVPHPSNFSLFLRLQIKQKGRHFDTTDVIGAESRAVLNTLTEHD
jgi:hypothetical protein